MDDDDIEWELSKMDEAERRREAPPLRTVYRPVDPGLKARILRMFGQPYDKSAIPRGQEFYLNGWDNGEDDGEDGGPVVKLPDFTARQGGRTRPAFGYDPWAGAWRPDWGPEGNPLRTMEERRRGGMVLPSRGDVIRPLSFAASGHDAGVHMKAGAAANPHAGGYADGGAYGDMTLPEGTKQSANNKSGKMAYPDLNDEQKLYIATVAGEAGGSSEKAQRSVAHVIMNRVGYKDWAKHDTVAKLLTPDQFSSINDPNNQPFQEMAKYLQNRDGSNPRLERMINIAMDVYHGKVPDFTGGAVMFYSPRAQAQLHRERPDLYLQEVPADWDFEQLQKLPVPLEEDDDFLFFKYK